MRKLFLLILPLISTLVFSQDFQISNSGKYSVDLPHIAFSGAKTHLVYGTNFYYYNFNINGPMAPIENPISPADNFGPNTTDVAVDPADSNHIAVVYYDYHYDYNTGVQFYGCYVTESSDGGQTFDAPTLMDTVLYGNSFSNLFWNMPQVHFLFNGVSSQLKILWEVRQNSKDTNAIYLGGRFGGKERVDDPTKNSLEYAVGCTVEDSKIAVSYGIMDNGNAKFYLYGTGITGRVLVHDDGQTFLTSDNFSKAFVNYGGKIFYIYSSFSHNPKLFVSEDWGATWQDKGVIDNLYNRYIAFARIVPTAPNYLESYYVKLLENDSDKLVFWVSKDLIHWQSGGQVCADSAIVSMATQFVDLKLNDKNKRLMTAWIDQRTGNEEIFYANVKLPELTSVKEKEPVAKNFKLYQNYPNPFGESASAGNQVTTIKYSIPAFKTRLLTIQHVTLKIYDILGNEIRTLVSAGQSPGVYNVQWNGRDNFGAKLPTGVYIYKLSTGNEIITKKMLLVK